MDTCHCTLSKPTEDATPRVSPQGLWVIMMCRFSLGKMYRFDAPFTMLIMGEARPVCGQGVYRNLYTFLTVLC